VPLSAVCGTDDFVFDWLIGPYTGPYIDGAASLVVHLLGDMGDDFDELLDLEDRFSSQEYYAFFFDVEIFP